MICVKYKKIPFLILVAALGSISIQSNAGFPVADPINLIPNFLTSLESTLQTAQQVEEYRVQLQQFQFELQNTLKPVEEVWDDAQDTINGLIAITDRLRFHRNQIGSFDDFLSKFQDVDYYLNSPCFRDPLSCSASELDLMNQAKKTASLSQKDANDALFASIDQQQGNLVRDSAQLQRLQRSASSADGQLAALGYANQLSSHQSNQLLQIRSILLSQQSAEVARLAADADEDSRGKARAEQVTKWKYIPSSLQSS